MFPGLDNIKTKPKLHFDCVQSDAAVCLLIP